MNPSHRVLTADRFPKLAFYFALLVLPGGSIALLLLYWLEYRKKRTREAARASAWVWQPQKKLRRPYRPNVWECG